VKILEEIWPVDQPCLYDQTLLGFRDTGELDRETLAHLDSLAGDQVRYLLMGRIEHMNIAQREETQDDDSDEEKTVLKTTPTVRVAFEVYDLQFERGVWSATLSQSKEESAEYSEQISGNLLEAVVNALLGLGGSGEKDYPPPPNGAKMLRSIFSTAADKPPGKPR
jgi:hypothetical protein